MMCSQMAKLFSLMLEMLILLTGQVENNPWLNNKVEIQDKMHQMCVLMEEIESNEDS